MATVDRNGCDGCGGEFTPAELYPVTMPNGDEAVCCPECRRHAKVAARKQAELVARDTCDGCGVGVPRAALADVTLPDGVSIRCCPECRREVPDAAPSGGTESETRSRDTDRVRNRCSQCRETFTVELYEVVTVDGRSESLCESCTREGRRDGIVSKVKLRRAEAYEILGVDGTVTDDCLRERYIQHVKAVHPDRAGGSRAAFVRVQRAYERLTE